MFDIHKLAHDLPFETGAKYWSQNPPRHIIVTGSSGAGKTTLVNFIKYNTDLVSHNHLQVPMRYITRTARQGDDFNENTHVSHEKFFDHISHNLIDIYWKRDLAGNQKEHYGFATSKPDIMALYSANNAIVKSDAELHPQDLLSRSLIIGVYCPDDVRAKRFLQRSPDVASKETEKRLADSSDNIRSFAHLIISNNKSPNDMGQAFEKLIRRLVIL